MAFDGFLIINKNKNACSDADIRGESHDATFKGSMDIQAFKFDVENDPSVAKGGGVLGLVKVGDFSIVKKVDQATPVLYQACCSGEHFGEAWVRVRKAGGATALVYLVYNFEDVFIKAVRTGGMSGDEIPLEEVTFGFAQFTIDYSKQAAAGSVAPGKFHGGWNIKANKKA